MYYTRPQLAEKLQVHPHTVINWCRGYYVKGDSKFYYYHNGLRLKPRKGIGVKNDPLRYSLMDAKNYYKNSLFERIR